MKDIIRHRLQVTVRISPDSELPKVGSILDINGAMFFVTRNAKIWAVLDAVVKGKVEHINYLNKFQEETDIVMKDWFNNVEEPKYYSGRLVHKIVSDETISYP
jgi:hypothetical protein